MPGSRGARPTLADLISSLPSAANALEYARKVTDFSLLRKVVECGKRIEQIGLKSEDAQRAASRVKDGDEGPFALTGFRDLDAYLRASVRDSS